MSRSEPPRTFPQGINLTRYLDDALGPHERRDIEEAMAIDPHLRNEVASLQDTVSVLRHMPRERAPHSLHGQVRGRTRPRRRASSVGTRTWTPRFPFEAALNMILILILLIIYGTALPAPDGPLNPAEAAKTVSQKAG